MSCFNSKSVLAKIWRGYSCVTSWHRNLFTQSCFPKLKINNLNFQSNIKERFPWLVFHDRKRREYTTPLMFLMYVKVFIALFPTQISETHAFYAKHYLIKKSKMKSWPYQKFIPTDTSLQSKLHQKKYTFWDEQRGTVNNSLKKLTGI